MENTLNWFLHDNGREARLARTCAQGVVGAAAAAVTYYGGIAPEWVSICVCPVVMAVLSPVMQYLGEGAADEG
ncbi:MAG: hypothetical protein RSG23_08675 [Gordonibacter sp.]|uniref:hypothetical protein n=1 Tax=Gordonibacter sp. TaxID=1968902 RepID=UPI002FC9CA1B